MPKITASFTLNGHELTAPVLNAGDWFGKTFLLEVGGSYSPLFLVVEAGSASDAIDELAESEEFGHHIVVDEADLGDYDPETSSYGPGGQVIDLDHLMIHGCEGCEVPFPCRYHSEDLPDGGVLSTDFCWDNCCEVDD